MVRQASFTTLPARCAFWLARRLVVDAQWLRRRLRRISDVVMVDRWLTWPLTARLLALSLAKLEARHGEVLPSLTGADLGSEPQGRRSARATLETAITEASVATYTEQRPRASTSLPSGALPVTAGQ
jgi:hypothetical protein